MILHASSASPAATYRVLARKYRPQTFADLIGQDVLVRVLTTAIEQGRLAQAFLLTGVRGVGKTTTARILARALNCEGPEGQDTPRTEPCGQCSACRDIAGGRHVDVLEMDAASRTGVDDIREIIESSQYRPVSARHKVYIIDEVHMLSKNAFNALLKTLEEPPPHIVFIFATTEIRKVPVTVVSRCQRFDLRRVSIDRLANHLSDIAQQEGFRLAQEAAAILARAAEGSVRDGLSLLDTAIAGDKKTTIEAADVKDILGLTDHGVLFDLLDHMMAGRPQEVLAVYQSLLKNGSDPEAILSDLLATIHWLTRLRVTPEMKQRADIAEEQIKRGSKMAATLTMPVLSRAWQIMLKGFQETRTSPSPAIAAEMVLIRLTCAADMPDPAALLRQITETQITETKTDTQGADSQTGSHPPQHTNQESQEKVGTREKTGDQPSAVLPSSEQSELQAAPIASPNQQPTALPSQKTLSQKTPSQEAPIEEPTPQPAANRNDAKISEPSTSELTHSEPKTSEPHNISRHHVEADPLVEAVRNKFPGSQITIIGPA